MTAEPIQLDPEPDETQGIDDLVSLARAFRHIAAARSRIAEIELTAQRERKRINQWELDTTGPDRRQIVHQEALIAAYARTRREDSGERDKSLSTPWGIVETRAQEDEFIRDDAVLLPWAESHGYIREKVSRELDWKRLKADVIPHMGGTVLLAGDVVPGIVHRPREPKVTVTPWT